jgi:hypothetical protein
MKLWNFVLMLTIVLVIVCPSFAQNEQKTALQVYETWRAKQTDTTDVFYTLAVAARRVSETSASVDILVAGEMQDYSVTVRPAKLDLDQSLENAGFSATSRSPEGISRGATANSKLTIETTQAANVVQISLTTKSDNSVSVSLMVPLTTKGYSSLMTAKPQSGKISSNQLDKSYEKGQSPFVKTSFTTPLPPNCYNVELNCGNGCSTSKMCKYCSGGSQSHSGNCITCIITCGCGNCGIQE